MRIRRFQMEVTALDIPYQQPLALQVLSDPLTDSLGRDLPMPGGPVAGCGLRSVKFILHSQSESLELHANKIRANHLQV